jgi:hypothetical protein
MGLTPAAPSATSFMWQGQQTRFNGTSCVGQIAFAVGATAVCYVHQDGAMRCAGRVGATDFSRNFIATPERDVDQILISRNVGGAQGLAQGLCVHRRAGTAACLGSYNWNGQYAVGHTNQVTDFTQWSQASNLVAIATGTWDQFCALDTMGAVLCSGFMFGNTAGYRPRGSTLGRLYVSDSGEARTDDTTVFRVANGRSECQVRATGLECTGGMRSFGTPGEVVDGFRFGPPGMMPGDDLHCWLDTRGKVSCTTGARFTQGTVLALAADYDTTSLCAVFNDGSLWCVGSNEEGKLGTGLLDPLIVETRVQPPGSVRIGCP